MRRLISLRVSLLLLLAFMAGCQALDGDRTASRLRRTVPNTPQFVNRWNEIHSTAIRPADHPEDVALLPAISLVGILNDVNASDEPHVAVETLEAIEVPLPPESRAADDLRAIIQPADAPDRADAADTENDPSPGWGHTDVPDFWAGSQVAGGARVPPCRDCQSGQSGCRHCYRPDAPLTGNFLQPQWAEEPAYWALHRIRVGDELEIKFPHKPLFSEKVMVREDGMITLPLIDPVLAAGLTPETLQQTLKERYGALKYDPSVARDGNVQKKYLLSVNDKVEVRFDTEQSESQLTRLNDSVTIRPDGNISLPLIGTLAAEGMTPEELEAELTKRYQVYYKEAAPVLIVREFTNNEVLVDGKMQRTGMKNIDDVVVLTRSFNRLVFVGGEVARPGFVKLTGPMTATQAIIAAGGLKRTAELRTVAMFRQGEDNRAIGKLLNLNYQWTYEKQKRIPVDMRLPFYDVPLAANDVIIVPKTMIAKVNDTLDQYVYQLVPMTRNTSFQYVYTTGSSIGLLGF